MRRKYCPNCKRKLREKHMLLHGGFKCSCGHEEQQPSIDKYAAYARDIKRHQIQKEFERRLKKQKENARTGNSTQESLEGY